MKRRKQQRTKEDGGIHPRGAGDYGKEEAAKEGFLEEGPNRAPSNMNSPSPITGSGQFVQRMNRITGSPMITPPRMARTAHSRGIGVQPNAGQTGR